MSELLQETIGEFNVEWSDDNDPDKILITHIHKDEVGDLYVMCKEIGIGEFVCEECPEKKVPKGIVAFAKTRGLP